MAVPRMSSGRLTAAKGDRPFDQQFEDFHFQSVGRFQKGQDFLVFIRGEVGPDAHVEQDDVPLGVAVKRRGADVVAVAAILRPTAARRRPWSPPPRFPAAVSPMQSPPASPLPGGFLSKHNHCRRGWRPSMQATRSRDSVQTLGLTVHDAYVSTFEMSPGSTPKEAH